MCLLLLFIYFILIVIVFIIIILIIIGYCGPLLHLWQLLNLEFYERSAMSTQKRNAGPLLHKTDQSVPFKTSSCDALLANTFKIKMSR